MLRVIATWDPKALPAPHVARDCDDEARLGLLPGIDAESWYASTWDQRKDYAPSAWDDAGCARESSRGVELCRHPEALLRDSPRLWDVVGRWRSGMAHELSRHDYDSLTNFEIECWLTLRGAHEREQERRMDAVRGDG